MRHVIRDTCREARSFYNPRIYDPTRLFRSRKKKKKKEIHLNNWLDRLFVRY